MSSMFAKIGSWFAIRDEDVEDDELYDAETNGGKRNVVPLTEAGRARQGRPSARPAPRRPHWESCA